MTSIGTRGACVAGVQSSVARRLFRKVAVFALNGAYAWRVRRETEYPTREESIGIAELRPLLECAIGFASPSISNTVAPGKEGANGMKFKTSGASMISPKDFASIRVRFAEDSHGTRRRYLGGCRCVPCRAANSRSSGERAAAQRSGDWRGFVPTRLCGAAFTSAAC